ncbi:unnamed protein product [Prorocentrum cordatum]|uniref:Glycosyltransferase 2-like domain-containing protein n=1 Tax=Prorocentrum cordatum TaxID=2364126 RepID=A0ABN9TU20_9DINO|nr:unnamed protein product [Polarella glacialis]
MGVAGPPGGPALAARALQASCWHEGFHYDFCCPGRDPACFDAEFTYERCCGPGRPPRLNLSEVPVLDLPSPQLLRRGELRGATVDLVVRTYWKAAEMVQLLLRSVEFYWPLDSGRVLVILDDSPKDAATCELLPSWATCILDPRPEVYGAFSNFTRALTTSLPGMLRKEMALLEADTYSSADYIAVLDADVVFVACGGPEILFAREPQGVVPMQYGRASGGPFRSVVKVMGLRWVAEFMDSFPQVFHRRHFEACRHFLIDRFAPGGARDRAAFHAAFLRLQREVGEVSGGAEFPSFHTVLGAYTYEFHQPEYAWAIQYGWLTGVPWRHTCPGLRIVSHVSYSSRTYVPHPVHELVEVENPATERWQMRLGPKGHWRLSDGADGTGSAGDLGSVRYTAIALDLMLSGVCAVAWRGAGGGEALKAEACGGAPNMSRLVLMNGYMRTWWGHHSPHCAGRRPELLLQEYGALLAARSFVL